MAKKLGLSNHVKELKFGESFIKGDHPFHTFRYDFMPASLDTSKRTLVDVGAGHQVTVTVPNVEGSGTANTVFKGSKKPYQKECVLIIDHNTGEITLEKLTYNVQLKKTRAEGSSKIRSNTPIDNSFTNKKSPAERLSPKQKTHPASFGRSSPVQKCSPLPKSPLGNPLSPNNSSSSNNNAISSMPSLSMLGSKPSVSLPEPVAESTPIKPASPDEPEIGVLSTSSSDSSSSSDDSSESSSSDDDEEEEPGAKPLESLLNNLSCKDNSDAAPPSTSATFSMPTANSLSSMPTANSLSSMPTANSLSSMPTKFSQLSEDLKLSESDSDSDG